MIRLCPRLLIFRHGGGPSITPRGVTKLGGGAVTRWRKFLYFHQTNFKWLAVVIVAMFLTTKIRKNEMEDELLDPKVKFAQNAPRAKLAATLDARALREEMEELREKRLNKIPVQPEETELTLVRKKH
eukprot:TRINITY_DN66452_c2_g2_i1.p1 TRINITY_DN66452_c2_g2~~TRINITY_DN66452_c2_g2_i1.p1  ORF type:complete len:128 (+),score=12.04 TRINITY_DN66452_c2_g2_i1:24-407(+)